MGRYNTLNNGVRWSSGVPYYQFINTGTPMNSVNYQNGILAILGSGVSIKLPKVPINGDPPDWSEVVAIPTGSTIESSLDNSWPYYTPSGIASNYVSRTKGVNQIQNIPEPVYSAYRVNETKPYARIMYSWTSRPGYPRQIGSYMPVPALLEGDVEFDLPPTKILPGIKEPIQRSPDADWPHDACIVLVESEEFGARTFIIMTDAQSKFYCWPIQYDSNESLVPENSPYINQAIKTNVPDYQVRSMLPPYPPWVHKVTTQFRDQYISDGSIQSLDPRYIWRFSPYGDKVVGIALERTQTDYEVFAQSGISAKYSLGTAEIHDKQQVGGDFESTSPIKIDVPGFVEFSLDITITGVNKEDFIFDMQLLRSQKANGTNYPIAAAYLMPYPDGTWLDRNVTLADTGDLIVAYLKLGVSEEQDNFINNYDSYGIACEKVFRKCWLEIKKYGIITPISTIPLWEFNLFDTQANLPRNPENIVYLSKLDLSTLSWVLHLNKSEWNINETPFATTTASQGITCDVFQETQSIESAVQYTVWNKVEKRESVGQSLNLFDWFDNFETSDVLELERTGTYWINHSGLIGTLYNSNNHWLFDKVVYFLGQALQQARIDLSDSEFIPANKGEFSTQVMSNVLDSLGGHSAISAMNPDYTVDYWNTIVLDLSWDIFSSAVFRKNAGDVFSLTPSDAGIYLSCYQELFDIDNFDQDSSKLTCFYSSDYLKRIYNFDIGKYYYVAALYKINREIGSGNELITSDRGFYSGSYGMAYQKEPITSRVAFKSQNSNKLQSKTIYGNIIEAVTSFYGNYTAIVPTNTVIGTKHIDFIKHVRDINELKHINLYNQAYGRNQNETDHDVQLDIYVASYYSVIYSVSQKIKIDGAEFYVLQYQGTNYFVTTLHNINLSKVNGSSLFVG